MQGSPDLGNQFQSKKWLIQYDFKYMRDDIATLSLITSLIPKSYSPYQALQRRGRVQVGFISPLVIL
jgi:hypothetical protein